MKFVPAVLGFLGASAVTAGVVLLFGVGAGLIAGGACAVAASYLLAYFGVGR